jgi:hypothetical protein
VTTRALLPLVALVVACSGADAKKSAEPEPVLVADLASRATPLQCDSVPGFPELAGSVEEASVSAWGTLIVVDKLSRTVNLFDGKLQPTLTLALPRDGPGAVLAAVSATLDGDSVLYIADQLGRRIQVYGTDGVYRRTIPTDFWPARAHFYHGSLYATATVMAEGATSLIQRLDGLRWVRLGVPPRPASDYLMRATANMLAVAEHGPRLLFAHQFVNPVGYVVADASLREVTLPIADVYREDVGFMPTAPFEETTMARVVVPAMALAPARDGGLLYLTRSGRREDDAFERALVEVDSSYAFVRAWSTWIRAGHLIAERERNAVLLIDAEDVWYRCPLT